jgi:glycosyltransferase involved in cell wall biosynthesis/SAM-dependent methyltransferase
MLFKNKKRSPSGIGIAYLLEDASLCGGVKVVFEHARLLSERGFSVTIVSKGARPLYFRLGNVTFLHIDDSFQKAADTLIRFDIVVATFFSQVLELHHLPINLVHFSQGFEADCPYWAGQAEEVSRAYALPIPKITTAKRVASIIHRRFSQPVHYIPQGVDLALFPPKEPSGKIEKIILIGAWENTIKGVRAAAEGFAEAKKQRGHLKMVRIATLPLTDKEKAVYPPDEYHIAVPPEKMGGIYRSCDLAIVPSLEGEGFGLPAVEAMASGLPVILTKIHSFLSFHSTKDYAYFVSQDSAAEIAKGIIRLCDDPALALELSKKGRRVAEEYPIENTIGRLVPVLRELSARQPGESSRNITYVYIKKPERESSMEVNLLRELSKQTFSPQNPATSISVEDPLAITVGEILEHAQSPVIAISLDDTLYFSDKWIQPLLSAIEKDIELASPVCSDFFPLDMPYYSPRTFNDVAALMSEKHRGLQEKHTPFPRLCYVVKKSSLAALAPDTTLSELPEQLMSAIVPSSLVHHFGDYYSSQREDLLPFVPHGPRRVLDVGCAKGFLGELIKKERGCEVYGIEINKKVAETAKSRLDDVFCTDIENAQLPFHEDLDVIIFADILEHLNNPWHVLTTVKKWMPPDGIVIASIPNTSHYSIILDLLRGRWDYIPFGLLCISHIRFFTRATIEEMFTKAGYTLVTLEPQPFPAQLREALFRLIGERIKDGQFSDEILHPGYYVVAKKVG